MRRVQRRPAPNVAASSRLTCPGEISLVEQENVRVCLRSLRARLGNWRNVERTLPVAHSVLVDMMSGWCEVSVTIAFRAAKVIDASIYDVIAGKVISASAEICTHCGKQTSEHWRCTGEASEPVDG